MGGRLSGEIVRILTTKHLYPLMQPYYKGTVAILGRLVVRSEEADLDY